MSGWDRWRAMGLETLQGGRAQGFFTPYRYADQVAAPGAYPELERTFDAARHRIENVLDLIDADAVTLTALQGPPPIPRWDQSWFPRLDGAAAWALVRSSRPQRIIEVGSGHSTRMLAHAADDASKITCIDPEPRADIKALGVEHYARVLSSEDVALFAGLQANDIAFFDFIAD